MTELTSKFAGFSAAYEFTKPVGSKKKSTPESSFKSMRFQCADSLVSCGRKAD